MFDYEGHRLRQPNQVGTSLVPTEAFENGDLSALLNRHDATGKSLSAVQIIDPITGTPFAGNIIPPDRISPIAKSLFSFWPKAQVVLPDPLSGINFIGTGNTKIDDDQRFVRIDTNSRRRTSCSAITLSMMLPTICFQATTPTSRTSSPAAIRTSPRSGFTFSVPR